MILIISYGNSLRRDDGAGLLLGRMLEAALSGRGLEVELLAMHQLTPDVALAVAADNVAAAIFVDTRVVLPEESRLALELVPLIPSQSSAKLGHHVGAASIMDYARLLYEKTPPAWLLTIPGVDFDHGEGLSQPCEELLHTLPSLLAQLPPHWPLDNA